MTRNLIFTFLLLIITSFQVFSQGDKKPVPGMEDAPVDTMSKKEVISWIFTDFDDTSRVVMDTVFHNRHLFNPNPGNIYLSSYGTPLLFNDFTKRNGTDFLFSSNLSQFFRQPSNTKFYRTSTPFTYLNFDTGGGDDAESDLEVFHTQNVNKLLNVGIDAKIISSQKFYERETSMKSHQITFFSSFEDTTYQLFTSFISNKSSHKHIGGIDDVKEITTAGYLENATSTIKSKHVDIQQRYFFGSNNTKKSTDEISIKDTVGISDTTNVDSLPEVKKKTRPSLNQDTLKSSNKAVGDNSGLIRKGFGVYHNFTFSVNDYKYTDNEVSSDFYQSYPVHIDSNKTKDKASQRTLSNTISLFFKSDHFDINLGLEHNYNIYSYIFPFEPEDTVINKYDVSDKTYNNIRFTGDIQLKWQDNFTFNGLLNLGSLVIKRVT